MAAAPFKTHLTPGNNPTPSDKGRPFYFAKVAYLHRTMSTLQD